MTRRVLLAGEGKSELGGFAAHTSFRAETPLPGVLVALLRQVAPNGFELGYAVQWKDLTIYRARGRLAKDELNTRALWLLARENQCDLIVFSRDRDADLDREAAIGRGMAWLREKTEGTGLSVVGGIAIECIEAWVLAVTGLRGTEALGRVRPKKMVGERGLDSATRMADFVEMAGVLDVPDDAASLQRWLGQARIALAATP